MPLYEVLTGVGALTDSQRERIADEIMRAHIEETDAPGELVHCVFDETKAGATFTNFEHSHLVVIRVLIRTGRPPEVRHRLMRRISNVYVAETGVPAQTVAVTVADLPPDWTMEAGQVLPEVGAPDEERRLARIRGVFLAPPTA